jgi:Calcineurin-like phosphoesterase
MTDRAFGDPDLTPDNFSDFSQQEISADSKAVGLEQLGPVPAAHSTTPMDLGQVIGADAIGKINKAEEIVFHAVGDTGGIHSPEFQFAVADAMAKDTASFWYHLGDVVYYFGQEQYYFEQFYDPYRDYNAPIFAIPGNHDGAVFKGETEASLDAFRANFCAPQPGHSPDSQGAVRTTMDQPGVYFTLNAPLVKFIGLYSNTSEGGTGGVIADPKIGNAQLAFLKAALAAAKKEREDNEWRALVIATHHPPFTGSPFHVPSPEMLKMIDNACEQAGIWPDLHLSGHAHLYERYTRTVNKKQIPYLVAGMGGYYNLAGLKPGKRAAVPRFPASGKDASGNPLRMEIYNDDTFGFVRITVSKAKISGVFVTVDPKTGKTGTGDSFTLDLKTNTVSGGGATGGAGSKSAGANPTVKTGGAAKKTPAKGAKAKKTQAAPAKARKGRGRKRPRSK